MDINRADYVEASILAKIFTEDCQVILVRVQKSDFADSNHAKFFELCHKHYFAYGQITKSILQDKAKIGNLFDYGTIDLYISQVADENIDALILELKDFARKREQNKMLTEAALMTRDIAVTSKDITSKVYSATRLWSDELESKSHTLTEVKKEFLEGNIGQRLNIGEHELDDIFEKVGSHYRTTEVCVAYEKHGKTTYGCMRSAMYLKQGYKGAYFTFEGGREDIYESMSPYLDESDDFFIIDDCKTLDQAIAKIWELKIRHNIDFIVIDYLQRIQVDGLPMHEDLKRIMNISPALTDICKRENLFGLLLAQPRKPKDDLEGWRGFPTAESIYGSGQIAKDAYIITALYRPYFAKGLVYYSDLTKRYGVKMYNNDFAPINTVVLRVLKQRKGVVKTDTVWFRHSDSGLVLSHTKYIDDGSWRKAE